MAPLPLHYTDDDYTVTQVRSEHVHARSLNMFDFISEKMAWNCEFLWINHWLFIDIHFDFH